MPTSFLVRAAIAAALLALPACGQAAPPTTAPGAQAPAGEQGPPAAKLVWPRPSDMVGRIAAAGLPHLPEMSADDYHLHAHLEVYKDGVQVLVPANLGIVYNGGGLSPLHTHEASGVIHVESPVVQDFTLAQFFALWDVPLDGAAITVNDQPITDPAAYRFKDLDLVTVRFGRP